MRGPPDSGILRPVPKRFAAGAVLTAALALVALPGLAGSRTPSPERPIPAVALQALRIDATEDGSSSTIGQLDAAARSANHLAPQASFAEPADEDPPPSDRPSVRVPRAGVDWTFKAPRYTLSGQATWYDNGTTAMRLPRGTVVVICGARGCVERTVTDWGPRRMSRVVDLMPSDFVRVCGCGLGTGVQRVTVRVY